MRLAWKDRVTAGPRLSELLDGLLEPVAEDRASAQEAIDVATGRAAQRRKRAAAAAPSQQSKQQQQQQEGRMVRMPDGSVVRVMGAGGAAMARPLPRSVRKPAGTRVVIDRSAGRLDVEIPPDGLSGNSVGTGIFALVWNAFVAVSVCVCLICWGRGEDQQLCAAA